MVVRDLFGNLPVRTKQRAIYFESIEHVERELDRLKMQMLAIVLAWPQPVRIFVSDQHAQQRRRFAIGVLAKASERNHRETIGSHKTSTFQLHHICTVLSHAGYIAPTDFGSWTGVSARTSQMFIRAAICLQPAPSKQVQFISLGIHPLESSSPLSQVLCREVNSLFAASAFGATEDEFDIPEEGLIRRPRDRPFQKDGYTNRQLKGKRKGADRWPMFYIRIDPRDNNFPTGVLGSDEDDRQAVQFCGTTVQLIRSMTRQFLYEHHFRPRAKSHRGGLQPIDRRSNVTEPNPRRWKTKIQCSAKLAKGNHLKPVNQSKELGSSPINPVPNEGRGRPHDVSSAIFFDSWSRIKSGRPRAVEDLLSGLPRSKVRSGLERSSSEAIAYKKDSSSCTKKSLHQGSLTESNLGEDVQLLLRDLSEDSDKELDNHQSASEQMTSVPPQSEGPGLHEGVCIVKQDISEDGTIVWKNPRSGRNIRINSRTGQSLPDLPTRPTCQPQPLTLELLAGLLRDSQGSLKNPGIDPCQPDICAKPQSEPKSWLYSLLIDWQNPVFRLEEQPIPSAVIERDELTYGRSRKCCHGMTRRCTEADTVGCDGRLSKIALADANILGQVDKKFILVVMNTSGSETVWKSCPGSGDAALVLIDQHAADERCRVEELYAEISTNNAAPASLPKPIVFEVTTRESELFRRERTYFEACGIIYKLSAEENAAKKIDQAVRPASARPHCAQRQIGTSHRRPASATASSTTSATLPSPRKERKSSSLQVTVLALPELVAEKCRLDPKMLIDILRSEVWTRTERPTRPSTLLRQPVAEDLPTDDVDKDLPPHHHHHAWLKRIPSYPRRIIDLLNSRACRSAIMFNDDLTQLECEALVKKLAQCAFPFQCAHGRPSMVVLAAGLQDLQDVEVCRKIQRGDMARGTGGQGCRAARASMQKGDGRGSVKQDNFVQAFIDWQKR